MVNLLGDLMEDQMRFNDIPADDPSLSLSHFRMMQIDELTVPIFIITKTVLAQF